jgi:glycosyltransferase involved in cell wall biosynthesis
MSSSAPAAAHVTVIIPVYNAAQYIGEALASVFAQTYSHYQVTVINDGSTDGPDLQRAIAPYLNRINYLDQENSGVSTARNAGILAARTPYVAMLDSDDAWAPEYLEVQMAALAADPTLDAVYPDAWIVGDHANAGRTFMDVCPSTGPVTFEGIVTQRCHVFTGVLARRDALIHAGLYTPRARASEDFELWARLVARGARIGYHRRPLVRFRKRRGSLSSDPVWLTEQAIQAYERLARELDLSPAQRTLLEDRIGFFDATLSLHRGKRAFFQLDHAAALEHLRDANRYFRSLRLRVVCAAMRIAPQALLHAYRWRDRVLLGADTRY